MHLFEIFVNKSYRNAILKNFKPFYEIFEIPLYEWIYIEFRKIDFAYKIPTYIFGNSKCIHTNLNALLIDLFDFQIR